MIEKYNIRIKMNVEAIKIVLNYSSRSRVPFYNETRIYALQSTVNAVEPHKRETTTPEGQGYATDTKAKRVRNK